MVAYNLDLVSYVALISESYHKFILFQWCLVLIT